MNTDDVVNKNRGILLDVGCGRRKQQGFVGLDKKDLPGVDIVWDLEEFPYPLEDESCNVVMARMVLEYIKPWKIVDVFNEIWRITKHNGQLAISTAYAGSDLFWSDPARCNGFTNETFSHFERRHPAWNVYRPSPWIIDVGFPLWQTTGTVEVVFRKVREEDVRVG